MSLNFRQGPNLIWLLSLNSNDSDGNNINCLCPPTIGPTPYKARIITTMALVFPTKQLTKLHELIKA